MWVGCMTRKRERLSISNEDVVVFEGALSCIQLSVGIVNRFSWW